MENKKINARALALDVLTRINDWLISGGSLEDEYVKANLDFASQFIEEVN